MHIELPCFQETVLGMTNKKCGLIKPKGLMIQRYKYVSK